MNRDAATFRRSRGIAFLLSPPTATPLWPCWAGLSAHADYPSTVLSDGPAGYWRFSETSVVTPVPMTATNLGTVGTANDGNYNGSYTRGVPGVLAGSTATY